jgi:hypothetical protein
MKAQTKNTGIATIKPKRTYTKRTKPAAVPRTARAYMKTIGKDFSKENEAVTALIKMHSDVAVQPSESWEWPTAEAQPKNPINLTGWRGWVVNKILGKVEIYNV